MRKIVDHSIKNTKKNSRMVLYRCIAKMTQIIKMTVDVDLFNLSGADSKMELAQSTQ